MCTSERLLYPRPDLNRLTLDQVFGDPKLSKDASQRSDDEDDHGDEDDDFEGSGLLDSLSGKENVDISDYMSPEDDKASK